MKEKKPNPTKVSLGYEPKDLSIKGMVIFGIVLIVVIAVTSLSVHFLFSLFSAWQLAGGDPVPPLLEEAAPLRSQPRLQRVPAEEMRRLRAADEAILNSYGWVDEEAGVVRIPIDRAMELTLERGLPTRSEEARE